MKKMTLVAGGLALIMALSGCGAEKVTGQPGPATGSGSELFSDAQLLVRAATAKTEQSKSSKFSMATSAAGQQITAQGEGRYDGANTAISMTMTTAGQTLEMRFVDKVMYLKVPESERAETGGKPWAKIPADSEAGKLIGASSDQAEQNDPSKTLEQIEKAGTITKSEQTTLDGQPVSHYWIEIDFAKLADQLPAGVSKEVFDQIKGKVTTFPMELWLNSDQLPVQIVQDLGAIVKAAGAPAGSDSMTLTMKYTDWGTAVDVQAPPADQVGELKLGG